MKKGQRQCLTSPDRQLRKHEKTMQKPCSGWSCNGSFGGSSGLDSARSRNSQTPAGFKPNLSKNQPPKKCLTSPSDAHKKDDRNANANAWHHQTGSFESMKKPCKNHVVDAAVDGAAMAASVAAPASVRHAAETAKPQPVQKPAPEKVPNVAFGRPQERWRKANANAWHRQTGSFESLKKPCKNHVVDGAVDGAAMAASVAAPASVRHGAETAQPQQDNLSKNQPPKKCLTSPSDAHKKDEERPTPMPDITRQAASKACKKPCKNQAASAAAPASVRHAAETAKPQQDSSPTCPKTSPRKTA